MLDARSGRTLSLERDRIEAPSFIALRTIIGYPAPNKMNTGKAHGAALIALTCATPATRMPSTM